MEEERRDPDNIRYIIGSFPPASTAQNSDLKFQNDNDTDISSADDDEGEMHNSAMTSC